MSEELTMIAIHVGPYQTAAQVAEAIRAYAYGPTCQILGAGKHWDDEEPVPLAADRGFPVVFALIGSDWAATTVDRLASGLYFGHICRAHKVVITSCVDPKQDRPDHKHDERLYGDALIHHVLEQHPNSVTAQDHDEDHQS